MLAWSCLIGASRDNQNAVCSLTFYQPWCSQCTCWQCRVNLVTLSPINMHFLSLVYRRTPTGRRGLGGCWSICHSGMSSCLDIHAILYWPDNPQSFDPRKWTTHTNSNYIIARWWLFQIPVIARAKARKGERLIFLSCSKNFFWHTLLLLLFCFFWLCHKNFFALFYPKPIVVQVFL